MIQEFPIVFPSVSEVIERVKFDLEKNFYAYFDAGSFGERKLAVQAAGEDSLDLDCFLVFVDFSGKLLELIKLLLGDVNGSVCVLKGALLERPGLI